MINNDIEAPKTLCHIIAQHDNYLNNLGYVIARKETTKRVKALSDQELHSICMFYLGSTRTSRLNREQREKYVVGQVCRRDRLL